MPQMTGCTRAVVLSLLLTLSTPRNFICKAAEVATAPTTNASEPGMFPVTITVDANKPLGELIPIWRFFGYDECNFTYMPGGQELLAKLGQLNDSNPQPQVYVRCHHLMTSGDGTPSMKWGSTGIYHEDTAGNPVYDWTIVDHIFDTYQKNHLKPYVQLGFMPKDLSSRPDLYPTAFGLDKRIDVAAGQAYPPKDFKKWQELCYQWVNHCIERYGRDEVQQWYWEVWNEPNIVYWKGTQEQYFELYDHAVAGVRRALPTARVGGNESAGSDKSLRAFLDHCVNGKNYVTGETGSPIDFISFHAKGNPRLFEGHVQMGIAPQLKVIDRCFAVVADFPTLKDKPIVIGESDPDGMAARPIAENGGLGYRNTSQFPAYTAACFAREFELMEKHGVNLEGALTWSFEFENKPFFAGYRTLSSNGIDLPILNLFRVMAKMSGTRVNVTSTVDPGLASDVATGVRGAAAKPAEVYGIAAIDRNRASILVYHYHDDDIADSPAADVKIQLGGLPVSNRDVKLVQYRIDRDHSNAVTVWQQMGSPAQPTRHQYDQLKAAGQLAALDEPRSARVSDGGTAELTLVLPRESVVLLVLQWD
jgi:xylan 1,4-beta-xylosidase